MRKPPKSLLFSRAIPIVISASLIAITDFYAPVAATTQSSIADSPGSYSVSATDKLEMLRQQPLVIAANNIRAEAERGKYEGFTGVAINDVVVELYWKGKLPSVMETAVKQAQRSAAVIVKKADYSRTELSEVVRGLTEEMKSVDSPVDSIGVPVGPGSLVATTDGDPAVAAEWVRKRLSARASKLPVKGEREKKPAPTTRYDDTAPFAGGAAIINRDNGGRCTTAFGITAFGADHLLTAGHCGRDGSPFDNGLRTRFVGNATRENVWHDIMLIRAPSWNAMYDGKADSDGSGDGEFFKNVVGWEWPIAGQLICQSGSTSGAVCGLKNSSQFQFSYCDDSIYGGRECYGDLVVAQPKSGGTGSRHGDSGGPVFTLAGDGQVNAMGVVSARQEVKSWLGIRTTANLIYQDFATVWRDYDRAIPKSVPSVRTVFNGRCLDGDLNTINGNGTKVQLWDCNASVQQSWIRNRNGNNEFTIQFNGRCLDADLNTIGGNGTRVQLWDCNGSAQQRWTWAPDQTLRNGFNGRCLDADLNTIGGVGTKVQLWNCNGQPQQRWYR